MPLLPLLLFLPQNNCTNTPVHLSLHPVLDAAPSSCPLIARCEAQNEQEVKFMKTAGAITKSVVDHHSHCASPNTAGTFRPLPRPVLELRLHFARVGGRTPNFPGKNTSLKPGSWPDTYSLQPPSHSSFRGAVNSSVEEEALVQPLPRTSLNTTVQKFKSARRIWLDRVVVLTC